MPTTFQIPLNDSYAATWKIHETTQQASVEHLLKKKVEACSDPARPLMANKYTYSALLVAVKTAFNYHYPLVLSPDAIWLTLTQGVARHINTNAEQLRKKFVNHEGKQKITVMCNGFVKGSPDNPWEQTLGTFSTKIKEHIGEQNHQMFVSRFTTTGPVEQAASEIVLMDAVQQYFSYECMTLCGIPQVTLLGEVADWKQIQSRTEAFGELGLEWWMPKLRETLAQFVKAAEGSPDITWWQSFFNQDGGSGGPYFDGNVFNLFPYLQTRSKTGVSYVKNSLLEQKANSSWRHGVGDSSFPGALSSVPFVWNYYGAELNYLFVAGLTGVERHPTTNAMTPVCGWAVLPADAPAATENSRHGDFDF